MVILFFTFSTGNIFQQIRGKIGQKLRAFTTAIRSFLLWLKQTITSQIPHHMPQVTYYHNSWFLIFWKSCDSEVLLNYSYRLIELFHGQFHLMFTVLSLPIFSTNKHNNSHILILSLLYIVVLVYLGCNSSFHLQF